MPHEVIDRWENLRILLSSAVDHGCGELKVDDILDLVLSGRMFIHASDTFAVTAEFCLYPRLKVMIVGFGAGSVIEHSDIGETLILFAKKAGANAIRTYCKNPAMQRYYRRWFRLDPVYTVLEKTL